MVSCDENDQIDVGESTSGSMATFHLVGDFLYILEEQSLIVFDISDRSDIKEVNSLYAGGNTPETLFSYDNTLFIGTTNGVVFFDITDKAKPIYISTYRHITSCDPVVSDGDFAYSTLRSGGNCGGSENLLDIIDLKDIENPKLHKSIRMQTPYGLGLFNGFLFVGEKENGMKVFDARNSSQIIQIGEYPDIEATDFVSNGEVLVINTTNGVKQVSVDSDGRFTIISEINYEL